MFFTGFSSVGWWEKSRFFDDNEEKGVRMARDTDTSFHSQKSVGFDEVLHRRSIDYDSIPIDVKRFYRRCDHGFSRAKKDSMESV